MSNTSHVVQSKLCKKIYIKQQQQQQQKQTTTKEENKEKTTTHKQSNNNNNNTHTTPPPPTLLPPKTKKAQTQRNKQIKNLQHINLEAEKPKPDARPIMICSLFGNQTV